ncbi:beta-1,3-glucan-binding protein-like [Hyposmocoma kahamanoa]|uniref:beta-1,3-glucan-binding protein-like n=1 Tax=Hyposmocoma kahamanoa TaxID=1477025 RepID=UPI000E6D69BC|nr:beta-1,3-glucan-binding protein-like [Hyposmocoma kahamanoa]
MESVKVARVLYLYVFFFVSAIAYEIPNVTIEVFSPKGFKASIPDDPAITLFAFQGRVNKQIATNDVGSLTGEITIPTNGQWLYEDPNVKLKIGDIIYYYVVVVTKSEGGKVKDPLRFTVTKFNIPGESGTSDSCNPTLTKIRGGVACAGKVIFEDDFNSLREDVWQIQQFIPINHPEYPFVSYQRLFSDPTVSVVSGSLRIAPKLQQELPGFNSESIVSGSLNLLSGCTGTAEECSMRASGASILPPVVSGRVVNKGFAFTYGIVNIRAKLPQGDWIYPEILLEPFLKKYGMTFASGVVKIASARGNRDLSFGFGDLQNNAVLYGGPIMDVNCRGHFLSEKVLNNSKMWGDDFHVYSVKWTPDMIALLVDNQEWVRIEPKTGDLHELLPSTNCTDVLHDLLKATGSKMAPFNDHVSSLTSTK